LRVATLTDSRILIVDDQADNLGVLAAVLELAGYTSVRCLNDSRQVLQVFDEFRPDLILLDLHMPHVDGLTVLDQLATVIPEDDYLPVLVLTGDGRSESKEKALSRGAKDFLSKPLNRTEVQLRVRNLLQTRCLHVQLRAQNESLEEQVQERTKLAEKLGRSNRALEDTNRRLRETQAHLIQSAKMASLGHLAAGIAHEINNPLTFIINNIFLVQETLNWLVSEKRTFVAPEAGPRIDKAWGRANDTREGAERVRDLVLKLRTFSRLDEGEFKTVSVEESIESVLLFLRHRMDNRIRVARHYGAIDQLPCRAGELNQVLVSLIANAIDSIDGSGEITLTTAQENEHFVIMVRDTGKGIPKEIRDRIFEPFFTTKPIGHGMGLGLAISYAIVEAHRGSIEFSTMDGEGTEFVVKIPTSG
jgi:two-component system NtrC family sensor kinase